jgi:hypothetical protein
MNKKEKLTLWVGYVAIGLFILNSEKIIHFLRKKFKKGYKEVK